MRDVATGQDLADDVAWVRFSDLSWTQDSKGFFYSRYPEPPKARCSKRRCRARRSTTTASARRSRRTC